MQMPQREPNGRLSRSAMPTDTTSPTAVKRLRDAALKGMADAQWGTALGGLFLAGAITDVEYAAGQRWARLVTSYRRVKGIPQPDAKAVSLERYEPSVEPDQDSYEGQKRKLRADLVMADFEKARDALRSAGPSSLRIVALVCEEGKSLTGWAEKIALAMGLDALAAHWHLTKQPIRAHVRS